MQKIYKLYLLAFLCIGNIYIFPPVNRQCVPVDSIKKFYLFLILIFFSFTFSDVFAQRDRYPSAITTFSGGATYCENRASQQLSITISTALTSTAGCNSNPITSIPITITWYANAVNSTVGGTVVNTVNSTANAASITKIYVPLTTPVGILYYYVIVSWNAGACALAGSLTTTTTQIVTVNSCAPSADMPNASPNLQTATANSLVIPMDNEHQNLWLTYPFNIKAYGLVNALLQNDIPVKWVITTGKAKDAIDFSANATRVYPSVTAAANQDFRASEFIVDSTWLNKSYYPGGQTATQVISAFANKWKVAVYRLTADVTVDVRYTLNQRPKIACFNNGTYQQVQTKVLDSAEIPNYVPISAGAFTGLVQCYTFCSEAHWSTGSQTADSATMAPVWNFVNEGGNFLAQCAGIEKYENQMQIPRHFHTTTGVNFQNVTVNNTYYNPDMAYNQFEGTVAPRGGTVATYGLLSTSAYAPQTFFGITSVTADTLVATGAHLASPDSIGSNVFYLGGHDYMTAAGGNAAVDERGNLIYINGTRMYLNAALIPARRPTAFILTVGANSSICNGQQTTLSASGPSGSTYTWFPNSSLNNPNSATPVATPTITTIYSVAADNGGCPENSTVTVTVNPTPSTPTAVSNSPPCVGSTLSLSANTIVGASYTWSGPNGFSSSSQDTTIANATTVNVGTYSVTATVTGCPSPSAITTVALNPTPIATVSPTSVLCFGGNNGSASVNASNGTPSYIYLWNNGQTTSSATGLTSGNYSVTTTDVNGCSTANTISVTEPVAALTASVSPTNVSCFGGSTGSSTVAALGGTTTYSYLWNNGQTTSSATGLIVGNYSVATTDMNGCSTSNTVSITQPASALSGSISPTNVSCFGGSNGSATVSASGGTITYSYLWNNGQTTSTATNLSDGNYSVTITDANSCIASATINITQPTSISASSLQTNICTGASNGSVITSVSGGVPSYTYLWNTGQTTSSATGLLSGNYSVTITDANACTYISSGIVSLHPAVTVNSSQNNVSCYGGNNGTATIIPTGGTPAFNYSWNNGQTTSSATNLSAGNYSLTITDANGCSTSTAVSITQPSILTSSTFQNNVSCYGGSNGNATENASGGTLAYYYLWNNGETTSSITNLIAGNYSVTIIDANGCTATNSISISQPISALASIPSQTNVSCNGGSNGSATVSAFGGTPSYSYLWNNGQTTSSVANLPAGNYSVTVTDGNNCTNISTITISEPAQLNSNALQTNTCSGANNGTAAVSVSGGTSPYLYLWNIGQTTSSVSGLTPGNYSVSVTDAKSCTSSTTVTITLFPAVTSSSSQINVSCFGGNNGNASVNVSGGNSPYIYNWSNGQTTSSTTNLSVGNYSVIITDANGCTAINSISISQPAVITSTHSSTNSISCASNGTATESLSGGIPPYNYLWNNGQTTSTITGLSPGNFSVTITDFNGCTFVDTVKVGGIGPPIANAGPDVSICSNNSTILLASGGINYSWSNGGTFSSISVAPTTATSYTVIATDASGCTAMDSVNVFVNLLPSANAGTNISICLNSSTTLTASGGIHYLWSTGLTTTSISVSPTTTNAYSVIVTDTHGCSAPASVVVSVNPLPVANAGANASICKNNSATLNASGGINYLWSTGASNSSIAVVPNITTSYTVIVTDGNGCTDNANVTVTVNPLPAANAGAGASICNGNSTQLNASGGINYSWSPVNNLSNANISNPTANPPITSIYTVTVTDANGCTAADHVMITVNPLPIPLFSADSVCVNTQTKFNDFSSGNIISWSWNFGDGNLSSLQNPSHTYSSSGAYNINLTVISAEGCTSSVTVSTMVYPKPSAHFSTNPTVAPMAGSPPTYGATINFTNQSSGGISYLWDFGDGGTSTNFNPQHYYSIIGNYIITLITTNQYGCTDTSHIATTSDGDIVFPNVFTPNANGSNGGTYDPWNTNNYVFFPFIAPVTEYKLQIFNRWGELIFESKDVKIGWDGYYRGQLCQQDTYVWKAYAKFLNGKTVGKAGDVTLLR